MNSRCVFIIGYGSPKTPYTLDIYGVPSYKVPCCHDWIVILNRYSDALDFNRTWDEYKKGFGECEGNFFIGLDNLHELTKGGKYRLRYEIQTKNGKWYYGEYQRFVVDDEDNLYSIHLDGYSGDAGDMSYENGNAFTTIDRDNDKSTYSNCAKIGCGGWWYNACYQVNLHGDYKKHFVVKNKAPDQYLRSATMMIQRDPDPDMSKDTYISVPPKKPTQY